MPRGANDREATKLGNFVPIFFGGAAHLDICTAACHLSRHRYTPNVAGFVHQDDLLMNELTALENAMGVLGIERSVAKRWSKAPLNA